MSLKKEVDFGKTSADYAKHRAGFPDSFFKRLAGAGFLDKRDKDKKGRVLDLGTGTGTIARRLAGEGFAVTGLDIAQNQLDAAAQLAREQGVSARFVLGTAEKTGQEDNAFDYVTAGQCWHWFDPAQAAAEALRVLDAGGRLVLAHFDWDDDCAPVEAMYRLRAKYNPSWTASGLWPFGEYPSGPGSVQPAGFVSVASFEYMEDVSYSHEGWRGRMRAYSGIGGSLPPEAVEEFDREFAKVLAENFPEEVLQVPHRIWAESFTAA
ncbi:MAG: methyltransferase domain-containing protein [Alphaproteobacteria bacterium]|nr:methyltransferase domain-containing protein [Alphaproteobacteria bacterium]